MKVGVGENGTLHKEQLERSSKAGKGCWGDVSAKHKWSSTIYIRIT